MHPFSRRCSPCAAAMFCISLYFQLGFSDNSQHSLDVYSCKALITLASSGALQCMFAPEEHLDIYAKHLEAFKTVADCVCQNDAVCI